MSFDLDETTRRRLGEELLRMLEDYFSSLPDRPVQLPLEQRSFGQLSDKMPESGEDPMQVLHEVGQQLIDNGFHVPSANYFGLMNPTPTYVSVLAEALVSAINPQLATQARSQLASKIENETVRWIGERVGWPGDFGGTFTSGGNEANFSALAMALCHVFPGIVDNGVISLGAQPVLYASAESHHSLDKSAALLGLGKNALRRIEVDQQARMSLARLKSTMEDDIAAGHKPFAIVATAGTTNSGAVDDIPGLSKLAKRFGVWLHVDGAYGAAAIFSDEHRNLVRGVELADSLTIDPHKWLAMPFAAGVVLTSRPEMLERTFGTYTPYMPKTAGATIPDNFKVSAQWSRRMNSLKFYLTLRVHGRKAYEELIGRQLKLARDFASLVRDSDLYELAMEPILPILNLRLKASGRSVQEIDTLHQAIVDEATHSGERWISLTRVQGRSVIRLMVISYLTTQTHMNALWEALLAAARKHLPASAPLR